MCGICGVWLRDDRPVDSRLLARVNSTLTHRGPEDEGYHVDGSVGLAMRRLRIIDVEGGHQPICNEDGTVWIVFNGEIYNYASLKADLENRGHRFSTRSDTETILHAYEEYGERCLDHLRGMFAFAIWDGKSRRMFLARDHLGIKPLYYAETPQGLIFASEVKAIIASGLLPVELDLEALDSFLSDASVPSPVTLVRKIKALPPGHALKVQDGHLESYRYWDLPKPDRSEHSESFYIQRTRELMEQSVRRHQISEVPLGAFLSGGIDSASIVALMSRTVSRPIRTFSVGFEEGPRSLNELSNARLSAEAFGTDHTEVIVRGEEVLRDLPSIIWYLDQPSGDGINTYFVSKAARAGGLTVALSGLGGDELFAGYPRFRSISRLANWLSLARLIPRGMLTRAGSILGSMPTVGGDAARKLAGTEYAGSVEGLYALARVLFWPQVKQRLYSADVRSILAEDRDPLNRLRSYLGVNGEDVLQQITRLEMRNYMGHMLLRDTDAMSMAHSLEVRVPFLDTDLVEFVYNIPAEYKLRNGHLKHILIEAMRGTVPSAILDGPKKGFDFPLSYWMRHQLRPIIEDALSEHSIRRRGLFEPAAIRSLYDDFRSGRQRNHLIVWLFVTLELWLRQYMDQPAQGNRMKVA